MPSPRLPLHVATTFSMLVGITACQEPDPGYITVAVYPSTLACVVKEVPVACQEIAVYLRDTMKLPANRLIYISEVLSDPTPKTEPLLDRIADGVRKVGYTNVRTARFDLK